MLLIVHAALTWALVGLILTIQVVHYPLFAHVGADGYAAYQQKHVTRITWLVAPLMLAEAGTGAALVLHPPRFLPSAYTGLGLALIALIWLSTALVQSPAHSRLAAGFDPAWHTRLVATNWWRTLAWLTRGVGSWAGGCCWRRGEPRRGRGHGRHGRADPSGAERGTAGVGTPSVRATAARTGVKPGTRERIQILAGKKVAFKVAANPKALWAP